MAKIQRELVLTNITFEILSDASGKISITDPLAKVDITDGSYTVKLGALTLKQFMELRTFCVSAFVNASDATNDGDSYRTVVVGRLSIVNTWANSLKSRIGYKIHS